MTSTGKPQTYRQRVVHALRQVPFWLAAILLAGSSAFFQDTVKSMLGHAAARLDRLTCEWGVGHPNPGTDQMVVLIGDLASDKMEAKAKVISALRDTNEILPFGVCQKFAPITIGDIKARTNEQVYEASSIVKKYNADIMIFGEVLSSNALQLRLVNGYGDCGDGPMRLKIDDGAISTPFTTSVISLLTKTIIKNVTAVCSNIDKIDQNIISERVRKVSYYINNSRILSSSDKFDIAVNLYAISLDRIIKFIERDSVSIDRWIDSGINAVNLLISLQPELSYNYMLKPAIMIHAYRHSKKRDHVVNAISLINDHISSFDANFCNDIQFLHYDFNTFLTEISASGLARSGYEKIAMRYASC